MKRITLFRNKDGVLAIQDERLAKAPSGNAQQRQKQIRHGWRPEWVSAGRPRTLDVADGLPPGVELLALGTLPTAPEIAMAEEIARYAENQVAFEQAIIAGLRGAAEVRFCQQSGLL